MSSDSPSEKSAGARPAHGPSTAALLAEATAQLEEERALDRQMALEDAHAQLEQQQAELETTNQQLAENAAELEAQAEELQRSVAELRVRTADAERAARRARFAGDVGSAITGTAALASQMQGCCVAAVEHLDAAFARVWVLEPATNMLVLTASAGLYTHLDGGHARVPVGKFKIGRIAQERLPHLTNDVPHDPRVSDQAWAVSTGMTSFAGYPLLVQDQIVGVMAMFARHAMLDADFSAFGTAATAISVAISNARLLESERSAREVAERERERTTAILEATSDAYFLLDRGFRIIAVNRAMEAGVGLSREQMLGTNLWEIFPGTVGNAFEHNYRQVVERGTDAHFSHDYSDGRLELVVEVDAYATPDEGAAVFWRDISARARAQAAAVRTERVQRLTVTLATTKTVDEVGNAVIAASPEALTAALFLRSPAADEGVLLRHSGMGPDAVAGYKRFPLTLETPSAECLRTGSAVFVASRDGDDGLTARFPAITEVAERLGAHSIATVPLVVGGETIGAVSFEFDAPQPFVPEDREMYSAIGQQIGQALERARLLAAEREARAAAETANQAKGDFLATMSHELRTPLNAMIGYTQLLDLGVAGPVTDQQREYLARLGRSSEHLLALVNDVLDLSRIDAGEMPVAREHESTGAMVRLALDLITPAAVARGVVVTHATPDGDGVPYVGDVDRVRQIVANLLSNAVKFTPEGGQVTIECATVPSAPPNADHLIGEGPWTYVRVADTGKGIRAEEHARIFQPFQQVEGGRTRTQDGTGLGLAISCRLAQLMGGDLTVQSSPGEGSVFTLWLPAARQDGRTAREGAQARGARASGELPGLAPSGLGEIGLLLRSSAEEILTAYAARLRADADTPRAADMRRAELEDHAGSLLIDLAQSLLILAESGREAPALMRDGSSIQRAIADAHGARRHAQGWDEAGVRRDQLALQQEVARVLRARMRASGSQIDAALEILTRLMQRADDISIRAWRRSAEDARRRLGAAGTS